MTVVNGNATLSATGSVTAGSITPLTRVEMASLEAAYGFGSGPVTPLTGGQVVALNASALALHGMGQPAALAAAVAAEQSLSPAQIAARTAGVNSGAIRIK
jgi:hypothetical protein